MANRIQIRHGINTPIDGDLLPYELGWGNNALYIGGLNNNQNIVLPINITGNAANVSGIILVSNGGTGTTSFTANSLIMSGSTTTSALTTRSITNNTSATAVTTGTNIPTMNTLYYALPKINNTKTYTSNSTFYAPTTGGTSGYVLIGNGTETAPIWSQTLAVANGGTGVTSIANIQAGKDGEGNTISTTYVKNSNIESGNILMSSISASSTKTETIQFSSIFSDIPIVIATLISSHTETGHITNCNVSVYNITTSGCEIRINNGYTSARDLGAQWIAYQA